MTRECITNLNNSDCLEAAYECEAIQTMTC
jgi:hypothetical protein